MRDSFQTFLFFPRTVGFHAAVWAVVQFLDQEVFHLPATSAGTLDGRQHGIYDNGKRFNVK